MTTSIREQVLAAFKTAIATLASSGYTVARNLDDAVANPPALVVEDGGQTRAGGSTGDGETFGLDTYTLHVTVWGYLGAATDEALGTAISEAYAKIVQAACADRHLGGVAEYLREVDMADPEFDHEKGHRPNAAIQVHFAIEFVTAAGNPYASP